MSDQAQKEVRSPRRQPREAPAAPQNPRGAAPRNDAGKRDRAPRPQRGQSIASVVELREWLATLEGPTAAVHVNGPQYSHAVLVVDFGSPLKPVKLSPEQTQDLVGRMRRATRDLLQRETRIGLFNDQSNGVWWTTPG